MTETSWEKLTWDVLWVFSSAQIRGGEGGLWPIPQPATWGRSSSSGFFFLSAIFILQLEVTKHLKLYRCFAFLCCVSKNFVKQFTVTWWKHNCMNRNTSKSKQQIAWPQEAPGRTTHSNVAFTQRLTKTRQPQVCFCLPLFSRGS